MQVSFLIQSLFIYCITWEGKQHWMQPCGVQMTRNIFDTAISWDTLADSIPGGGGGARGEMGMGQTMPAQVRTRVWSDLVKKKKGFISKAAKWLDFP